MLKGGTIHYMNLRLFKIRMWCKCASLDLKNNTESGLHGSMAAGIDFVVQYPVEISLHPNNHASSCSVSGTLVAIFSKSLKSAVIADFIFWGISVIRSAKQGDCLFWKEPPNIATDSPHPHFVSLMNQSFLVYNLHQNRAGVYNRHVSIVK